VNEEVSRDMTGKADGIIQGVERRGDAYPNERSVIFRP